jgi:NAD-dependent deacetylase
MPQYALDNGAFLAIINMSDTPYDHKCNVLIRDNAGPVLSEIVARVEKLMAK